MKTFEKVIYVLLAAIALFIIANTLRNCRKLQPEEKPAIPLKETIAPEGGKYSLNPEVQERVEPTNK